MKNFEFGLIEENSSNDRAETGADQNDHLIPDLIPGRIEPSTLDFSAWQNRKTDYGKTSSIEVTGKVIKIKVYK